MSNPNIITDADLEAGLKDLKDTPAFKPKLQAPPGEKAPEAPFVARQLREAASLYTERNALYGNNYKRFGHLMMALFPDGLELRTADDFARFGVFVQTMSKQTRYAANFHKGGHDDSQRDTIVYAAMNLELDREARERKG